MLYKKIKFLVFNLYSIFLCVVSNKKKKTNWRSRGIFIKYNKIEEKLRNDSHWQL